ncbi:hypothetical protein [Nocardioides marinquilinus]|uniref:hypothetical protein n=1 Tax=Nocardioides marinquilinus TaxID=1210400 RepID=UPI0031EB6274
MVAPRVLVEGDSDRRALEVLARRLGVACPEVVVMQGITNLPAHLRDAGPVRLLHDAGESDYVARVLARVLVDVTPFVCDADLEDELIRAVGVPGVLAVVEAQGERGRYERMAQQPAQRDRPDHARLHRWLGARSGHKLTYAGLLADAVPLDDVPAALLGVLGVGSGSPASGRR